MWKKLTEKRIEGMVNHYAPFLGVGHWSYDIEFRSSRGGTWMETDYAPTLEHFYLWVFNEYMEGIVKRKGWDLKVEAGVTVIHELLHVMWSPFEAIVDLESREEEASYRWCQEPIIERTARLLYEYLPKVGD